MFLPERLATDCGEQKQREIPRSNQREEKVQVILLHIAEGKAKITKSISLAVCTPLLLGHHQRKI